MLLLLFFTLLDKDNDVEIDKGVDEICGGGPTRVGDPCAEVEAPEGVTFLDEDHLPTDEVGDLDVVGDVVGDFDFGRGPWQ